jgi:phenylacetate-CoA ligase
MREATGFSGRPGRSRTADRWGKSLAVRAGRGAYAAARIGGQRRAAFRRPAAVERAGSRRVRSTLRYAYDNVPFYREVIGRLGARPADFRTVADLRRLPIIDRADVQRDPERFLSTAEPEERCESYRSSGSSGLPLTVHWSRRALVESAAYVQRYESVIRSLLGKRAGGYRETILTRPRSNYTRVGGFYRRSLWVPSRFVAERQLLSSADPPSVNLERACTFGADVLRGYGSHIEQLFSLARKTGVPLAPKLVVASAEPMVEPARRRIERDHGIPVISSYGSVEAFHIGFQCETRGAYHLNVDLYPLRIVDDGGEEAPIGESGEVVISNLVNRAMVLLNYRIGDLARRLPGGCECGRSLPLLDSLIGRNDEWIDLGGGRRMGAVALASAFNREPHIRQYQLRQPTLGEVEAVVVASDEADRAAIRSRLRPSLEAGLERELKVSVSFVDALEGPAHGKRKVVVRSFDPSPEPGAADTLS